MLLGGESEEAAPASKRAAPAEAAADESNAVPLSTLDGCRCGVLSAFSFASRLRFAFAAPFAKA